jgi:hypothetical protein
MPTFSLSTSYVSLVAPAWLILTQPISGRVARTDHTPQIKIIILIFVNIVFGEDRQSG